MSTVTEEQAKLFDEFVKNHDYFFVTGHKEPDGDSISSAIGIGCLLQKKQKRYQLLSVGPFKRSETKEYEKWFSPTVTEKPSANEKVALIIVDCSEYQRIGEEIVNDLKDLDVFIIDHHKTADVGEKNAIIYPDSPAASFLVLQLYEKLVGKPDKKLANILFFGICTDTGFFKFLETGSKEVFQGAARLVENGADPKKIYTKINSGKPFLTRKLLGVMLERAKQYYDGRLIVTYETLEDTQIYGKSGRDSDALYSLLLSAEKVEAVLFVRQDTDKTCTAGLRSNNDIDVSKIASVFGGGGHKNASGLSCEGNLNSILPKMIDEFKKYFD